MRVSYFFKDNVDEYQVDAEVYPNGIVLVLFIRDSYGCDVIYEDFSPDEQKIIKGLALRARDVLEGSEDVPYDEDNLAGAY